MLRVWYISFIIYNKWDVCPEKKIYICTTRVFIKKKKLGLATKMFFWMAGSLFYQSMNLTRYPSQGQLKIAGFVSQNFYRCLLRMFTKKMLVWYITLKKKDAYSLIYFSFYLEDVGCVSIERTYLDNSWFTKKKKLGFLIRIIFLMAGSYFLYQFMNMTRCPPLWQIKIHQFCFSKFFYRCILLVPTKNA